MSTPKPLSIAVVGGRGMPSRYSGVESIWEGLYPRLAAGGHRITVYCRPGVTEQSEYENVRLVTTGAPGGSSAETLSHTWTALRHAARHGDANGRPFDVVALHALPCQLFARQARRAARVVISHVHGLDWQRAKWRNTPLGLGAKIIRAGERQMVRHATAVAVCAPNLVDYYRDTYGLETTTLRNGIHVDDQTPRNERAKVLAKLGLTPDRYVVGVGRLVEEKRTHDLVAAHARLAAVEGLEDVKLAIVGEGPESPWLAKLRATAGSTVVFAGHQSGDDLEQLFRNAGCYATASELEGLPMSVLEAMERRACVIASDIPPHRLMLGEAGTPEMLFPVGDVAGLADRLRRVLERPTLRYQLADLQRAHVRAEYSWDVLAAKTAEFYRSTVASAASRTDGARNVMSTATGYASSTAA